MASRYKSALYEYCQKMGIKRPFFEILTVTNGHQAEVSLEGTRFGWSRVLAKKKEAENDAARLCLVSKGIITDTPGKEDCYIAGDLAHRSEGALPGESKGSFPGERERPLLGEQKRTLPGERERPLLGEGKRLLPGERERPLPIERERPLPIERERPLLDERGSPLPGERERPLLSERKRLLPGKRERPLLDERGRPLPGEQERSLPDERERLLPGEGERSLPGEQKRPLLGEQERPLLGERERSLLGQQERPLLGQQGGPLLGGRERSLLGEGERSLLGEWERLLLCGQERPLLSGRERLLLREREQLLLQERKKFLDERERLLLREREGLLLRERERALLSKQERTLLGERERPLLGERERPLLGEQERPLLGERERPLLGERERPLLSEQERPLLGERERPLLGERERLLLGEQERPLLGERDRPLLGEQERLLSSERERPLLGECEGRFLSLRERPLPGELERPLPGELERPSLSELERPFQCEGEEPFPVEPEGQYPGELGQYPGKLGPYSGELGPYPGESSSQDNSFETSSGGASPFPTPPVPSSTGKKMPKSMLFEYCQKNKMEAPLYDNQAVKHGSKILGFICIVTVNHKTYTSDIVFKNKREAEHHVSEIALAGIRDSPRIYQSSSSTASTATFNPDHWYKSMLQEHLHQRGLNTPVYDTALKDSGFMSAVHVEGMVINGLKSCSTKKLAEQSAAKAALMELGIKDPETVALRYVKRKSGDKFQLPQNFPFKAEIPSKHETETWIHRRPETSSFDSDSFEEPETGYVDFHMSETPKSKRRHDSGGDKMPYKRQRVGEKFENRGRPSCGLRRSSNGYEVDDAHIGNLTVGEAWPEKRNVVIVGSNETSIPLYCVAAYGRCALEEQKTGSLVDIQPGHRLVGLEGHYIERGGQIVLKAQLCEEVVEPEEPDRVLVSCGVVVLHCIPKKTENGKSCDVNILLKRYLCSQAFVNVVRSLAQFFRNLASERSFRLDKEIVVAHISEWMLEEVMAVVSMTEDSLRNVFAHSMKFNNAWGKFLKEGNLPEDLKELQSIANEELARRACSQEDQNQDRFRPWRLPKGNFHHRILSTGVFIESPAECAMRELKEETGIRLNLKDVSSSPFVDIDQTDNLNPHKGDVARYYLCGIITEEDPPEGTYKSTEGTENTTTRTSEAKTPDKSRSYEDGNIIRSPLVAGAIHEECAWYDIEAAKETSQVFSQVYNSSEFQKLLATLKKVVSEM